MDEQRLSELFSAAAGQPPPAGFDETDVRAESARITARNRRRLAGGAFAVIVLAGVGTGIGVVSSSSSSSDDRGGDSAVAIDADEGAGAPEIAKDLAAAPPPAVAQAPAERSTASCAVDPALITRLLDQLTARGTPVLGTSCGPTGVVVDVPGGALTLSLGEVPGGLTRTRSDGTPITLATTGPLHAELRQLVDELSH